MLCRRKIETKHLEFIEEMGIDNSFVLFFVPSLGFGKQCCLIA